ncbi:hypothetical protein PHYPSEUDO_008527 [Phytophthora pseudosyringae]|uniref:BTB domain-containing protein n=1 Tax=Phytophthora pseudosyringae TaxID=221518 RepID=A0A8T1VGV9_9STRA|nr:hypothetical protein PHYPSEUDO_008527 [Phytophthora pseudosyringae]
MAAPRWTAEHGELLLSVAGRHGTWPERMRTFTDELNKRRDFLPVPEPACTLTEIQDHLKELCEVVPCGPVKSLATGFYPKRTELLIAIHKNTVGESNEVKTVLFNHAIKEKGWSFTATLEQVEWKLNRLGENMPGQANGASQSSNNEKEAGSKRTSRKRTTDSRQSGKRQKVTGNDVAKESAARTRPSARTDPSPVVLEVADGAVDAGAESDLNFLDNSFERESDDSDTDNTSAAGTPEVAANVPAAARDRQHNYFTSGTAREEGAATETRGEVPLHGQNRVGVNIHDELTAQVSEVAKVDDQNDMMLEGEGAMTAHLHLLVNNELMSDVTFIVEGTMIFAHKCICIRSNYFNTLFSGESPKSSAERVEISGVSRRAFLVLLEFVYTDRVNVSRNEVKELYVAANRCGIESLKRKCSKKLMDSLSVDNVAGIMNAALQHDDPLLREKCFSFMLRNLEFVSKTKSFREMATSNPEMVVKIVQEVSSLVHIA